MTAQVRSISAVVASAFCVGVTLLVVLLVYRDDALAQALHAAGAHRGREAWAVAAQLGLHIAAIAYLVALSRNTAYAWFWHPLLASFVLILARRIIGAMHGATADPVLEVMDNAILPILISVIQIATFRQALSVRRRLAEERRMPSGTAIGAAA